MNIQNNYYAVASNDYEFLNAIRNTDYYNKIAVESQQVVEKLLKHIVNDFCIEDNEAPILLKTHNLKKLARIIMRNRDDIIFDIGKLAVLEDFYFDAKYPGPNYIIVSKEMAQECLDTTDNVKATIDQWLQKNSA